MAWQFSASNADLVTLAFSMNTYTWGPMIGLFLLSRVPRRYRVRGVGKALLASIAVVLVINEPEILNPLIGTTHQGPWLAWPWLFPIGTLPCFAAGFGGRLLNARGP
jgi:hypothetical protein